MLGENLQKARVASGFTQEEVADKLFYTRQAISRWEQEKTTPNIDTLIGLAELYGTDLNALAAGLEAPERKKKLNFPALFGMVCFNAFIGFWLILSVATILASIFVSLFAFIASPAIIIIAGILRLPNVQVFYTSGAQGFDWWQYALSFVVCAVGVLLTPLAWRFTKFLYNRLMNYLRYNLKSFYY